MDLPLLFSQLIRIDGLDVWEGLGHVGCSREVYADALRLLCRELNKKVPTLVEFLKNENWKEYAAAMHALKGGLAGIGAWELARKARELEDAVRNENYGFCKETSGNVLEEMNGFAEVLRSTILFSKETVNQEQVSGDYIKTKLKELHSACSSGNSAEADALVNELKSKTLDEKTDDLLSTICAHVENLDYHLVLEILGKQSQEV